MGGRGKLIETVLLKEKGAYVYSLQDVQIILLSGRPQQFIYFLF